MRRAILLVAPAVLALGLAQPVSAQTFFSVATGEGTNAVSIAKFRSCQFFGTELMLALRFNLFFEQEVASTQVVLGSGEGGAGAVLDFADTLYFDLGFLGLAIITSGDLIDGDLSDLIADFEAGNATLVVNTADNTLSGPIFGFSSEPSGDAPATDPPTTDPPTTNPPTTNPPTTNPPTTNPPTTNPPTTNPPTTNPPTTNPPTTNPPTTNPPTMDPPTTTPTRRDRIRKGGTR